MFRGFLALCCGLLIGVSQAAAQVDCQLVGAACEDEAVSPPKIDFEFDIKLKPRPPKQKVTSKPKVKTTLPKRKVVQTKKVVRRVIERRIEVEPQPKPTAVLQKPKPKLSKRFVPQANVQDASWIGLPEIPVTTLLARDLTDIQDQYVIDLNQAAFAAAGINLQTLTPTQLAAALGVAPAQVRSLQNRFMFTAVLKVPAGLAATLANNPLVAAIDIDTQIKAAGPKLKLSWGLDRLDSPTLPLDRRFDRKQGTYKSRIYLFDTEVDAMPREFGERVSMGARFVARPDDKKLKCREHGTEMASLLAGANTGSAPHAEIIQLVVLPCERQRTGDGASIIEAAEWLLNNEQKLQDQKPVLANMSLAGKWSRPINKAVTVLTQNAVVVIVAAGNNAADACRYSPAAAKEAITVAATDANDETPGFSNFGKCVDINAPGRLLTALTEREGGNEGRYVTVNGTSGAAAMVTGLLARALQSRGIEASQKWLAEAALPAKFWRKDQLGLLMMQANADWRRLCRLVLQQASVDLYAEPKAKGKVVRKLASDTLLSVEDTKGAWFNVALSNGSSGWLQSPNLLKADQDVACEVPK